MVKLELGQLPAHDSGNQGQVRLSRYWFEGANYMLQHTQAMPPFCFRIVCAAACIVDSPEGMTAVPMSSNMEMQRSCSTVEHI